MKLRSLDDVKIGGKRVLLRADLNVPMNDGAIDDDFRIKQSLPTLQALLDGGAARVVVCSHLGRPKGAPDPKYSLRPVAERLERLIGQQVVLAETAAAVGDARITMLENLRFFPGETKNAPSFAEELASLADVYVDDAFGAVHRAHASVAAVATLLPSVAGQLLRTEIEALTRLVETPEHPFVAVLGGAKVSDKLAVIESLLRIADRLVIGGAMCFTFLRAQDVPTGRSLVEPEMVDTCARLLHDHGDRLLLPVDFVVARAMEQDAGAHEVVAKEIPDDEAGFDIGTASRRMYVDAIREAKTVMWNGPMGVFELDDFAAGTRAVAAAVAKGDAWSVVGGGDSVAAIERFGYTDGVDHISTGGGAMLEFLEGKELPGLVPLRASL